MAINCWLRIAKVPFMMIFKHLVRGNIPLNISLVMMKDLRGISLDGRGRSLHARGGGTDAPFSVKEHMCLMSRNRHLLSFHVWFGTAQ